MSEIIFPQQLVQPYELNYENDIVNSLLLAGTGVYFSDDNLATVINYYDNSFGTPANITSNELASLGGYRIGVDISGLTSGQQTSITENPYQLFKTPEEKRDDYCINLTTAVQQISLPFAGAFTGTITLDDDTTQAISGSGTYVVDGATPKKIKSIHATDTVNDYLWIFDKQGTYTTVADEYNGTIAMINGSPTFELVIEKQVYTVGTGKDYSSWGDFNNAHKTDSDVHLQVEMFDVGHVNAGSTVHFDLVPYITYNYNEPIVFGADSSGNVMNANGFTRYVVNNLKVLNQGKQTLGTSSGVVEVIYNNLDVICDVGDSGGGIRHLGSILSKTTLNNCRIIQKNNDNVFEGATGELIINNSIIINEYEGAKRAFASAIPLKITNSVVSGLGSAAIVNESYCVSADASATGIGSLTNQPIYTWFVDVANDDYNINDTGQVVLKGAGWNGSDITSSFYAAPVSGITLLIDSGAFNITGEQLGLIASYKLLPQTESFNLVGTALGLAKGSVLIAESGTYTLSGSDLQVRAAYKEILESGSYDLTGTDVTLIYTPVTPGESIVLESGSFNLIGSSATLTSNQKAQLESGGYTLTGTDINLSSGSSISLDSGDYSLSGSDIALVTGYGIILQSGDYVLNGTSVTLRYSGDSAQTIGNVTAGFAENPVTVGYRPTEITVNFKES